MAADAARAKTLFLSASELADPTERAAYLDRECGGDADLRARVDALLRAHDGAPLSLLAEGGAALDDADGRSRTLDYGDPTACVGSVLAGKYKLVELIGEGGMGAVYVAQQIEPVRGAVAVKVVKAGMDSKAVLARFEAERQALALMDHPNIARVLDGGATDGGRPFFVMELVKGTPITTFCDERKLTPRQRLELFVPVCQAIQHAHQKGVIHRDMKPSNVLVAMYDDRPVPKVIDFGVAKAAGQALTDLTLMTGFGAVVGTPEYMSPEQASLNNLDVDTRSDVYSLGVLLYELLTGTTPVDRQSLNRAAVLEVLRIVREVEAPRPSARLSSIDTLVNVAANRATEPAKLSRLMKGELDWVVMKALEKERARRYETANSLARDVQRYLADDLVEARPPSAGYRLRKFVRRHPLELALAGMFALLLAGGVTVAWWQNEQASARRQTDLGRQVEDEKRQAADDARLGRNAEAVAVLLGQCEEALKAGDAAKAQVALEAARKRSAEGGAEKAADRLGRLDADLTLLRELDFIDQFRWTPVDGKLPDPAVVATRTREALTRFGADPDATSADEAAARASASLVRDRIIMALDRLLRHQKKAGARALLRRVDNDPYRDAVRDAVLADDPAKLRELAKQDAALKQPAGFAAFMGESQAIDVKRRGELLQAAVRRRPADLGLLMALAGTAVSTSAERGNEQLRWYQAAVAAAPSNAAAHSRLGQALGEKGQLDEAIACYRKAIELDPKNANVHYNLGIFLCDHKRNYDEAMVCFRKVLELDPTHARAQTNLGVALSGKGQKDEAIACFRKALDLDPKLAHAHNLLGCVLLDHNKDPDAAIPCFKRAIELEPNAYNYHIHLGHALLDKGQMDEAIASYNTAIKLNPKSAAAHANLGIALWNNGQKVEAIAAYKKAIELAPEDVRTYPYLGRALARQGRFAESLAAFKRLHELGTKQPGWRLPSAEWVREAEAKAAIEARLPAFLKGEYRPVDNKERLVLAAVCQARKHHHAAAALYTAAFAADAKLADDLQAEHRHHAACHAALAAAGQGEDTGSTDDKERTRLRQQALDWLRADLVLRTRQVDNSKPADRAAMQQTLRQWQKDPDLASLRDVAALAKLSAEERAACEKFWADVAALLKKAEGKTK